MGAAPSSPLDGSTGTNEQLKPPTTSDKVCAVDDAVIEKGKGGKGKGRRRNTGSFDIGRYIELTDTATEVFRDIVKERLTI